MTPADPSEPIPRNPFPIVGVGASAGGLDAVTELLAHLPEAPGMGFVVVQHLDPHYESHLAELLSRATRMPVVEATDGLAVRADHVYVIAPNTNLTVAQGLLHVTPRGGARPHLPVDLFMRSLAAEQQIRAIGVLLSGSGSDGTLGLCEIKAVGGITFAQDEQSARQFGMPGSAASAGCVDFVLAPAEIAKRLEVIGRHPYLAPGATTEESLRADDYGKVVMAVRSATGVDFSQYRDTTLRRRIGRRMALHGKPAMADYVKILEGDRAEIEALYRDLLINVTSFFRDPAMFDELKRRVFPVILEGKSHEDAIRVWVAGCSSGQEAYSLAMALVEFLDDRPVAPRIQIFATDLADPATLEKARAGVYPESVEGEVSADRLRRFFVREDHVYRIDKAIRDACVFARQNVATDPPFSHVDLVSCRNVLMYMGVGLQKQVIPIFHYALNPDGFLVLGPSETVGDGLDLFEPVDRTHKIYAKKPATTVLPLRFPASEHLRTRLAAEGAQRARPLPTDFQKEADRILLSRYAPPGVLVNDRFEILQFRGRTSSYLESPPGDPTLNVLKMVREELFLDLRGALQQAAAGGEPVVRHDVRLRRDDASASVTLRVTPVRAPGSVGACYLVLFEARSERRQPDAPHESVDPSPPGAAEADTASERDRELVQLRQELAASREYLQSATEQQEATNEELRSANEEILSANEELQSTNEELQTAKEELQSANEELTTVNEQLQSRNAELAQATNDLTNLLTSTDIPMVMVGADLRVRRLTPAAQKVLNLLPTDVGRPIAHIRPAVEIPALEGLIASVIERVQVWRTEVQDRDGRAWQLRIHPYRTSNHRVDGAVIILVDIDDIRRSADRLRTAMEVGQLGAWEVELPSGTLECSEEFKTSCGVAANAALTYDDLFRAIHPDDRERVRRALAVSIDRHEDYQGEYRVTWPDGSVHWIENRARAVFDAKHQPIRITGMTLDLTDRKRMEGELVETGRRKDEFLATLSHELRNPLAAMRYTLGLLHRESEPDEREHAREVLDRQLVHLIRIVDGLLDVSRITQGRVELRKTPVALASILEAAIEACQPLLDDAGHELIVQAPDETVRVLADPTRLSQVVANLLNNAAKFTPSGGRIWLTTAIRAEGDGRPSEVAISVRDTGIGIDPAFLPRVFEIFTQARPVGGISQGMGVGLTLARQLAEMHGGRVDVASDGPGQGAEFVVHLPLLAGGETALAPGMSSGGVAAAPVAGAKLRVLVAEDNVDSAEMLKALLCTVGHDVRIVHDGPDVLEAVAEECPDVLLLDLGLPTMSGYEVARRLRARPGCRDLPIVALSGWGQDADRRKSVEAGIDRHLVKPAEPDELERLLSAIVPRAPASRSRH